MFRPTNACFVYGILPEWAQWSKHSGGPELKAQLFAKIDVREAIVVGLQCFPNDLAAPDAANAYGRSRRGAHISESVS